MSYGARAVNKGGLQSLPRLVFPGGVLAGCEAGFLNGAKIKGSHTAMKTGMLAAESVFAALRAGGEPVATPEDFERRVRESWVYRELEEARNFGPAQHRFGTFLGGCIHLVRPERGARPVAVHAAQPGAGSCVPETRSAIARPIAYAKPDGVISFDRLSSVYLSSTNHEEDQPCHLQLAGPCDSDEAQPARCTPSRRSATARPAYTRSSGQATGPRFQINAQNCVHCKTCDIKDPAQNINWVVPEGGGGPNYTGM